MCVMYIVDITVCVYASDNSLQFECFVFALFSN